MLYETQQAYSVMDGLLLGLTSVSSGLAYVQVTLENRLRKSGRFLAPYIERRKHAEKLLDYMESISRIS